MIQQFGPFLYALSIWALSDSRHECPRRLREPGAHSLSAPDATKSRPRVDGAPTGRTGATVRYLCIYVAAESWDLDVPLVAKPSWRPGDVGRPTKPAAEVLQIRQPTSLKVGRVPCPQTLARCVPLPGRKDATRIRTLAVASGQSGHE
jgi:hypothetical protein